MLLALAIRDVVLIEKLDIAFQQGLSVLTGETGAGKSILLDSLGLALGARADSGLVRRGASQLSVTAEFALPPDHPARALLAENGLETDGDTTILRRTVTADGRSRAFIDDQPVGVALLRRVGEELVEIHGQFESHGLLNPLTHRDVLDAFGVLGDQARALRSSHSAWKELQARRLQAEADLVQARKDEDFLRHSAEELASLDPKPGEEESLAQHRAGMMHGEKLLEGMNSALAALTKKGDVGSALRTAQRALERVADKADGRLDGVIAALDRAADEAAEAMSLLDRASSAIDLDPRHMEQVEERLFALRSVARKHNVSVDNLAALRDEMTRKLQAVENGGEEVLRLKRAEAEARALYVEAARALSQRRIQAASRIDKAISAELPPLKLERAVFRTRIEPLPEEDWGEAGLDKVAFEVATNPGAPAGPIGKIASGGELSRFMLALKVVLARVGSVHTLVFDEVDSGIGGATAAAVGERLSKLAGDLQVLVVTHSPQVAAKGGQHYRVAKSVREGQTSTHIAALSLEERREEIARMISGENITDHARAAAASLMAG